MAELQNDSAKVQAASANLAASVKSTIASNASLVAKASTDANGGGGWGVVFSGDATLPPARYEVDVVAPKLQLANASVYFRQGYYRSVALADNRTEAEQLLVKAKQRRADAYIVNMASWCPRTRAAAGYLECATD